jgi:hypothetical protein
VIKPLSLIGDYHLVWSHDPALDAPPQPDAIVRVDGETDDAWAERRKEYEATDAVKAWAAWQERLRIAQQTGKPAAWQALMKPGQQPTLFRMKQIPATQAGRLMSIARNSDMDITFETMPLAFRVGLAGVEQWAPGSDFTFKEAVDATFPKLGRIAEESVVDRLGLPLIVELGSVVLRRCQEADPLF